MMQPVCLMQAIYTGGRAYAQPTFACAYLWCHSIRLSTNAASSPTQFPTRTMPFVYTSLAQPTTHNDCATRHWCATVHGPRALPAPNAAPYAG